MAHDLRLSMSERRGAGVFEIYQDVTATCAKLPGVIALIVGGLGSGDDAPPESEQPG